MRKNKYVLLGVTLFILSALVGFASVSAFNIASPATAEHSDIEGVWEVSSPAEAARFAGFTPTTPSSLPDGMEVRLIQVTVMDLGGPFVVVDTFLTHPDATDFGVMFTQADRPFGVNEKGTTNIGGMDYHWDLTQERQRLSLSWFQDGYQYQIIGDLRGKITEESLEQIAMSTR